MAERERKKERKQGGQKGWPRNAQLQRAARAVSPVSFGFFFSFLTFVTRFGRLSACRAADVDWDRGSVALDDNRHPLSLSITPNCIAPAIYLGSTCGINNMRSPPTRKLLSMFPAVQAYRMMMLIDRSLCQPR
jgi:hypothetical protein